MRAPQTGIGLPPSVHVKLSDIYGTRSWLLAPFLPFERYGVTSAPETVYQYYLTLHETHIFRRFTRDGSKVLDVRSHVIRPYVASCSSHRLYGLFVSIVCPNHRRRLNIFRVVQLD